MLNRTKIAELVYNVLQDFRTDGDDKLVEELVDLYYELLRYEPDDTVGFSDAEYQEAYDRAWRNNYGE